VNKLCAGAIISSIILGYTEGDKTEGKGGLFLLPPQKPSPKVCLGYNTIEYFIGL